LRGSILRIDASIDQKLDVKIEPRSETTESGSPCNLTTQETKRRAKSGAEVDFKEGTK